MVHESVCFIPVAAFLFTHLAGLISPLSYSSLPSPLSLSLREIAAYSPRLVRAAERPNDGRTDGPTAIASLSHSLAAHTTAPTIPLPSSLSLSLSRSLACSLALAATRDQRAAAGGFVCGRGNDARSLRPSLRPSDRSKAMAAPPPSPAQSERDRPTFFAPTGNEATEE